MRVMMMLLAIPLIAGCSQVRTYQPPADPNTLDSTQFVHYLARVPVVNYAETCRAMVILLDEDNPASDQAGREALLSDRGVVRAAWHIPPDHVVDMGTLAFMLSKACDLPPTAGTVVFGSWGLGDRRYAHRQVVSEGLMEYAPVYKPVAGGDLVLALSRADDYIAKKSGGLDVREPDSPGDLD